MTNVQNKFNFVIRDREAGNVIDYYNSREEAEEDLNRFEEEDKEAGIYWNDFYEIVELES